MATPTKVRFFVLVREANKFTDRQMRGMRAGVTMRTPPPWRCVLMTDDYETAALHSVQEYAGGHESQIAASSTLDVATRKRYEREYVALFDATGRAVVELAQ
jgi:hypothetical protein